MVCVAVLFKELISISFYLSSMVTWEFIRIGNIWATSFENPMCNWKWVTSKLFFNGKRYVGYWLVTLFGVIGWWCWEHYIFSCDLICEPDKFEKLRFSLWVVATQPCCWKLLPLPHDMTVKTSLYCLFCLVFADFWCIYVAPFETSRDRWVVLCPIFM